MYLLTLLTFLFAYLHSLFVCLFVFPPQWRCWRVPERVSHVHAVGRSIYGILSQFNGRRPKHPLRLLSHHTGMCPPPPQNNYSPALCSRCLFVCFCFPHFPWTCDLIGQEGKKEKLNFFHLWVCRAGSLSVGMRWCLRVRSSDERSVQRNCRMWEHWALCALLFPLVFPSESIGDIIRSRW